MQLEEFLSLKNVTIKSIIATAKEKAQLVSGDDLLLVGSLSEGLATVKSDFDMILITDRPIDSISKEKSIAWVDGQLIIDMDIKPRSKVTQLTNRFLDWCNTAWTRSFAADFSADDRKLLHRYLQATLLDHSSEENEGNGIIDRCFVDYSTEQLARLKLHNARHTSRSIQVDMMGHRARQDYRSLVFAAQELLGHANDALNASHLYTNSMVKWRSRITDMLPDCGINQLNSRYDNLTASQLIWQLMTLPTQPTEKLANQYAHEVTHFCRLIARWAEMKLVFTDKLNEFVAVDFPAQGSATAEPLLPCLQLDVDFVLQSGQTVVARLNEFGQPLTLTEQEFSLLMMCDGQTSAAQAVIGLFGQDNTAQGQAILDNLIERCNAEGFLADN
jgi:hypothetical protein